MGNFADNHDEYSRLTYYCRYDALRIRQALVWAFLWRGIPILYYGTEQGLDGHQGPENTKGQDALRESLWHTGAERKRCFSSHGGYRRDTWQYLFIKALRLGFCNLDTSRAQEPAAEIAGHRRRGRRGEGDHSHDAWMQTQP